MAPKRREPGESEEQARDYEIRKGEEKFILSLFRKYAGPMVWGALGFSFSAVWVGGYYVGTLLNNDTNMAANQTELKKKLDVHILKYDELENAVIKHIAGHKE